MLNRIKHGVVPTIWVNYKALRMNMINYIMLVVVFPLSYLTINIVSSTDRVSSLTGMYISVLLSLFINMQAALVSSANQIGIIEMYTVYGVKALDVFMGQSLLHFIMALLLLIPTLVIAFIMGCMIHPVYLLVFLAVSFLFLYGFAVFLGGLIANPNLAAPMINLVYMLLVIVTPMYADIHALGKTFMLYLVNPFFHLVMLFRYCIGEVPRIVPVISIVYLLILGVLLMVAVNRRWQTSYANEKLTIM